MNFLTMQTPDGGMFRATPETIGFSNSEGAYYIRRNAKGNLDERELDLVRSALERGAYRLANTQPGGNA